ncbi:TonB-dependent receptor plug domain-containing protein [Maribacter sp. PR1]|uniref:TonB-dependent receptor plug domain-containing protein n=1 Tax=Maribacter cobaltidurans TaxID=1178778 RepID=A0ABU7IX00_9FLAO|nr:MULTISPECIES: TonB-dependent receptor plug domain-containing protein [Maribacter]MDC6390119.1 TonB-dependent receptor plug domain-containing protein [Maribacter sp. PR1]MEE1977509.1 TonB-dependent receptor plug domain-containing protein [Maribacter cobaltidurans]
MKQFSALFKNGLNSYLFICLLVCCSVKSQKSKSERIKIEGVVTDAAGNPIKNAVLYVDSVKTFERSNKNGFYKFRIDGSTKFLSMFSELHGIQNTIYNGQHKIDFQFDESYNKLSERELENMGYTIRIPKKGTVDPSKFKDYSDIFQLIREMFTGVVVNGNNIVVRGKSTFGSNTQPLFIVDDTYVNDISNINPIEVRSIELLKGSDATLYGSRGGNGVFLIYLKK